MHGIKSNSIAPFHHLFRAIILSRKIYTISYINNAVEITVLHYIVLQKIKYNFSIIFGLFLFTLFTFFISASSPKEKGSVWYFYKSILYRLQTLFSRKKNVLF